MIPVTANDARRARLRVRAKIAFGLALAVCLAGWLYKRSVDPINARTAFDQGARQLDNGRYQDAILNFTRAVDLKSDFVEAFEKRGQAYFATQDLDRALHDLDSAIHWNPTSAALLTERATVYLQQKHYSQAEQDCSRAIALNANLSRAYNVCGVARRAQGNVSQALTDLERAVELLPSVDNLFQRGATYQLLGEHAKAIDDFSVIVEREPDNPHPLFARAESRRAIGDTEGAQADLDLAHELDGQIAKR